MPDKVIHRPCPICQAPHLVEKVVTTTIVANDNMVLVDVEAQACVECDYFSVDADNAEKMDSARDALMEGRTDHFVTVGVVYRQP